jgi:DNA-binding MltR family transcriptional regulator
MSGRVNLSLALRVAVELEAHANAMPARESDRSIAIVGASLVEAVLEHALAAKFVSHRYVKRLLAGPLGRFSVKIDVALAIGLIEEEIWEELHRIRKIRNEFAHHVRLRSFNDKTIRPLCEALWLVTDRRPAAFRTRYVIVCANLATFIGATGVTRVPRSRINKAAWETLNRLARQGQAKTLRT